LDLEAAKNVRRTPGGRTADRTVRRSGGAFDPEAVSAVPPIIVAFDVAAATSGLQQARRSSLNIPQCEALIVLACTFILLGEARFKAPLTLAGAPKQKRYENYGVQCWATMAQSLRPRRCAALSLV